MSFFTDTAVAADGAAWAGEVRPGWDIAGNANGGYLAVLVARALAAATGRPDPVTVTAHYLAPARVGPVRIDVEVLKQGRLFATAVAQSRQLALVPRPS